MKKLLAIDGNSILNRQFYGSRPLTTKSGVPTNATLGFTKVLLSQIEEYQPDFCAVAFDLKAPTFRHLEYAEYKAGRHAMPEELAAQFPYTKRMVSALGVSVLSLEGYEADDIIGSLSTMAENEGYECRIVTGDKDSLQLISDKTHVMLATTGEYKRMDVESFFEKYGVRPEQFVDVKALMGDSSDNIPGVPGIGEKTALKLIAENSDLEGVFLYAEAVSGGAKVPSVVKKLCENKESAFMSRHLARIVRDAPLGITLEAIKRVTPDELCKDELLSLCTELEFLSLISKLSLDKPYNGEEKGEGRKDEEHGKNARRVSADELSLLEFLSPLAFYEDEKSGVIHLSDKERSVFCECTLDKVKELFTKDVSFIVCDFKALYHRLYALGIDPLSVRIDFDISLAAYVLDSSEGSYTPERLAAGYLGYTVNENNLGVTLHFLKEKLTELLDDGFSDRLYKEIEFPLARTLYRMEREGFMVDIAALRSFAAMLDKRAFDLADEIYSISGIEFNINSPKQLGEVLFEKMGLPAPKKTKTGYSTSAEVLEKLAPTNPIIGHILNYRQVTKLKSTYADGLYKAADEYSRVHTTFTQTVTATGRLSSVEPNLQNIPIRTELGREMRRCFVAKEGYLLVDADYSQIELRLLAAISGDGVMIDAFKNGIDVHTVTASQVFGIPISEVTQDMRKKAKAVNFGIVYGMGEYSLAGDIHVSVASAAEYIRSYKEKYAGVATYLREIVERARKDGYVTSLLGRKRMIPDISSPKAMIRAFGERVAMNSPIQGSAADIIKIAMLRVEKALDSEGLDARLVLQVHDELIIEASERDTERARDILVREMENALLLEVPLTVSVSVGKTWYECK